MAKFLVLVQASSIFVVGAPATPRTIYLIRNSTSARNAAGDRGNRLT
jgi:hypothetical protein